MRRLAAPLAAACAAGCFSAGGPPDTPFNRGVDAYDAGRLPEAIRWFRRAAELVPDDARPRVNLALAYDRAGERRLAERFYREALARDPEEAVAWTNLGALHVERHDDAEAARCLAEACRVDPTSAAPWVGLGWFHEQRGRLVDAERAYAEAIRREPTAAAGHYRLGALLSVTARPAEAEAAFRRASAADPDDAAALRGLCACCDGRGAAGEKVPLLQRLLLLAPHDVPAWHALGRAYLALGDPERATQALWQARDRAGTDTPRATAVAADLREAYARLSAALPPSGNPVSPDVPSATPDSR